MTETRYTKRTIEKFEFDSHILEEKRGIQVYLPPGFNEIISYPVVYCQDGKQFFDFGRIATEANRLILDEGIKPMIIVGVEMRRSVRTEEYSPTGSLNDRYTSFFVNELVPYIERKYPIRTSKKNRILAGDSLGGTVSLHIALEYPALFANVILLSGAFFNKTQARLISENDLSWLNIYMVIGLQETNVETEIGVLDILDQNRKTKELLINKNAKLKYQEKNGEHKWGFWQKEIPYALKYYFA